MDYSPTSRVNAITPFHVMDLLQKAKHMEACGRDVIHLEIGEPDFPTPQAVSVAAIRHIGTGQVKYTAAAGLPQLRERIAGFYRDRYGVGVDPARIFITPGASGALLLAFALGLEAGDTLLMADPCYPCNANFAALFAVEVRAVPVDAGCGYQLNGELIRGWWTPACKGVLLASPANPTGMVADEHTLSQAVAATSALGGVFYSDEIYHGLTYRRPAASALQFSDQAVVINSFSKYFGMTGWRIGWLVVPEGWIGAAQKLAQSIFIATASHAQHAALAAFEPDTLAELERRRLEFARRGEYFCGQLRELGFGLAGEPEGAFYVYADCSALSGDSLRFADELLAEEAVAVTPGMDFGAHRAGRHLRFAYTAPMDRLEQAVERLRRFITKRIG